MIIWGGVWGTNLRNTGGRYDPVTNSWTPVTTAGAPTGRAGHTAIWTGEPSNKMIIWGGSPKSSVYGAMYEPAADTWTTIDNKLENTPKFRSAHTAVWTGKEMIVWGGHCISTCMRNDGGRFDPAARQWSKMAIPGAFLTGRRNHTAAWTGTEMIIWGGVRTTAVLRNGARYNPQSDSWTPMSVEGAPARVDCTAVWSGKELLVWGGLNFHRDGYRYDLATDKWKPMSLQDAPPGRGKHTAVWTGTEMIVWGGMNGGNGRFTNTGGRYEPETDQWLPLTLENAPDARINHTALWTGTEMIIWGGMGNLSVYGASETGGRYNPGCGVNIIPSSTRRDAGPTCAARCAVQIIEPVPDGQYDREIPIKLKIVPPDADIQRIEVLVDGESKFTLQSPSTEFNFDCTELIGKHTIQVRVFDANGHKCTSPGVPVRIAATVKVLSLILDPTFEFNNGKTFRETFGWQNPDDLIKGFMQDLLDASGGFANYKIVETITYDGYPTLTNGHIFDDHELYNRWNNRVYRPNNVKNRGWANLEGVPQGKDPDTNPNGGLPLGDTPDTMRYAQSFKAWGVQLKKIQIGLSKVGAPAKPIKISVRNLLDGNDLWGQTILPNEVTSTSFMAPTRIEVGEPDRDNDGIDEEFSVDLLGDVLYYLVVQFPDDAPASPDPNNYYKISVTNTDSGDPGYTDEAAQVFRGPDWTGMSEADMSVKLSFKEPTDYVLFFSAVPFTINGRTTSIAEHVREGTIDEVWAIGGPMLGMFESVMVGTGAYDIYTAPITGVDSGRPFEVMGFNYEREVAQMLHSYGHRSEFTMKHIYGGWSNSPYGPPLPPSLQLNTNWEKFSSYYEQLAQSKGISACGNVHWPPNAVHAYDYVNMRKVKSTADNWLKYPKLTGAAKLVSANTWKGPDFERNYFKWWYKRLPKANGRNQQQGDGKLNNWWRYIVQPAYYKQVGAARQLEGIRFQCDRTRN